MSENVFTAVATPNIAFVKYWGKRSSEGNLPNNSSVSMTFDETLKTVTSVVFSKKLKSDRLYINGELQDLNGTNEKNRFVLRTLEEMRTLAKRDAHALIVSENHFPTGSGLASSAAGATALISAAAEALGLNLGVEEKAMLARGISGSACRSMLGGFVLWKRGERIDGSDSNIVQIGTDAHWPELIDVVAIVSEKGKEISSSAGHDATVKTSELYRMRPQFAEANARKAVLAIKERDFGSLAEVIMRDSDNMHATMLDTWPPIHYMTDKSWNVVHAVQQLNKSEGGFVAAYTFDAGPNAHVITTRDYRRKVRNALEEIVPREKILDVGPGKGPRITASETLIDGERLLPRGGRHVEAAGKRRH